MKNNTTNNNDITNTGQPQENATKNSAQKPGAGTLAGNTEQLKTPDNIRVPKYLKKYIEAVDAPAFEHTTPKAYEHFLLALGEGALAAKIAEVEDYNLTMKAPGKKRIPDRLSFEDAAIIMLTLYTFKNIRMTDKPDDLILALYDRSKGTYAPKRRILFEIMERISPDFKKKDMEDVIDKIERSVPAVEQTQERNLFAVKNGIYDQETKILHPFDEKYVFLTKIPVDYKVNPPNVIITAPDGHKWDVDSWLLDIMNGDKECEQLMWQVMADCLQPNHSRHRSIWFYSEKGNNGKGTIGQLIKNMLGKGNYSTLSVADYKHEYMKVNLIGTAANISDENDADVYIDSIKDYKASVTGDDININIKYENPINVQLKTANIQMMNGLPKTKDKSESFYRRLILVPFMKSFTNNGERKYIKDDYIGREGVLEYALHKALNLDFEDYSIPRVSAELLATYKEKNNPVMEFWNELKEDFIWDVLPTNFLYDVFKKWYDDSNPSGRPISKSTFIDTLRGVIQTQGDAWEDKADRTQKVRVAGRMDADEPMISEYGLDKPGKDGKTSHWASDYQGTNNQLKRNFKRSDMYRGFVRL